MNGRTSCSRAAGDRIDAALDRRGRNARGSLPAAEQPGTTARNRLPARRAGYSTGVRSAQRGFGLQRPRRAPADVAAFFTACARRGRGFAKQTCRERSASRTSSRSWYQHVAGRRDRARPSRRDSLPRGAARAQPGSERCASRTQLNATTSARRPAPAQRRAVRRGAPAPAGSAEPHVVGEHRARLQIVRGATSSGSRRAGSRAARRRARPARGVVRGGRRHPRELRR